MSIVTKDPHSWFVCTNGSGETQTVYNDETYEHNYPFGFEVNFADAATPQENTVTLYNMSKEHRAFYHRKQKCYVAFNWGKSKKILTEGYITKIDVPTRDGVTESQVITFTEGTDYANIEARKMKITKRRRVTGHKTVKVCNKKGKLVRRSVKTREIKTKRVNKTYRKGTDYMTLIKGIASQSGIKIAKIDLAKNPKLKKAYTATGKPLTLLKQIVKKTESEMTYIQGKLEIVNPKASKRTWYVIDDQDLVEPPASDEASDGEDTYEITIPLVPDITVNVGIHMKSKYLTGDYYVKSGKHTFDGENPQTQCSIAKV
ncbi:hypothetical protein [Lactobacillus amylolyticus]|uniref:hypothetical protein n=1 Tax=Lactobacillus amylolyticus TaxID=83683 RepID=UPI002491E55E|nr:hypothetical protein [Lactobacillus amylolyticus]